jgi:excisionase family DNA binding protein
VPILESRLRNEAQGVSAGPHLVRGQADLDRHECSDESYVGVRPMPKGLTAVDEGVLLTVTDVATLLRVPVSWVYEHTRRGAPDALPAIKVGKYVRFHTADVRAYIERRRLVRTSR